MSNTTSTHLRTGRRWKFAIAFGTAVIGLAAPTSVYAYRAQSASVASSEAAALKAASANAAAQRAQISPKLNTVSTACVRNRNLRSGPGHFRFMTSACENASRTVATFPLHKGVSHGKTVYYVLTDTSDLGTARRLGINYAPKLKNAAGTAGVQKVTINAKGLINFPATVNFHQKHVLVPGRTGFPPAKFHQPSTGFAGYSPLIELPSGVVLDAPQIANRTGQQNKVIKLDTKRMKVQYVETEGRYEGKHVHYVSFDSSLALAGAIENMTYAPAMAAIPGAGDEGMNTSARETLMAFINGPTGANQPERQGINSAILDHLDPHNILHETPMLPHHPDVGDITYSPMWDVHLIQWTPSAIASGDRVEVRSYDEVVERVAGGSVACEQGASACTNGLIQIAGGKPVTEANFIHDAAAGFIVNCPLVSIDLP